MPDDQDESAELAKTCAKSGCKVSIGRGYKYCFEHRE